MALGGMSIPGVSGSSDSVAGNTANTQAYSDITTANPQGNQSSYASTNGQASVSISPLGGTDGQPVSSRAAVTPGAGTSGSDMSVKGANAQMGGNHPSGLKATGTRAEPTDKPPCPCPPC